MKKYQRISAILTTVVLAAMITTTCAVNAIGIDTYIVQAGDSLYKISQKTGISIGNLQTYNKINGTSIYPGQTLMLKNYVEYTVKSGDSLWSIGKRFGLTVDGIRTLNGLTSDTIRVGMIIKLDSKVGYVVKTGDTLWNIANSKGVTVSELMELNRLANQMIESGQVLLIPMVSSGSVPKNDEVTIPAPSATPVPTPSADPRPSPVTSWPSQTYIVQAGDTAGSIAKKFGVSSADLLKFNYMTSSDWFNAGEKIAINGYAPRNYAILPGQASVPERVGTLVDWFLDGQYLLKRGEVFTITDVLTGKQFKVRMMGGYNHSDVETLTSQDTQVMYELFGSRWQWQPRAVVVFKDGMNIAASLSGMPHSFDTISDNNMSGHCDLYLLNSIPHSSTTEWQYVDLHYQMIQKAAGK